MAKVYISGGALLADIEAMLDEKISDIVDYNAESTPQFLAILPVTMYASNGEASDPPAGWVEKQQALIFEDCKEPYEGSEDWKDWTWAMLDTGTRQGFTTHERYWQWALKDAEGEAIALLTIVSAEIDNDPTILPH